MKKIMILGLMLAMTACSNEPTTSPETGLENLVRDILFASIKKSYIAYGGTTKILQQSGGDFTGITSVETTTIDALNFSMPVNGTEKIAFEYVDVLDDAWLIYKATYKDTVRYTAFMSAGADGNSLMIEAEPSIGKFRVNKADIKPTITPEGYYQGSGFLVPPTKQNSQDSSIIEMTSTKASN